MKRIIRIGSRESKLAVNQSLIVMEAIRKNHPEIELELVTMKTTGDKVLDKTVDQIGGKGLFVKELDEALSSERVDLCVHSYKDMPVEDNPDFPIVAVSPREDPRDVLLLPAGMRKISREHPAGCSSKRRRLQFEKIYPGWEVRPVRGNVLTRLEKLDREEYGALVLAAAGIRRLGLWERVYKAFSVEEILPCACQGILAVQGRRNEDMSYLSEFHSTDSWDVSLAERGFIHRLEGGCSSPAAAYGTVSGGQLHLQGLYVDEDGRFFPGRLTGARTEARELGIRLAEQLLDTAKRGVMVG